MQNTLNTHLATEIDLPQHSDLPIRKTPVRFRHESQERISALPADWKVPKHILDTECPEPIDVD